MPQVRARLGRFASEQRNERVHRPLIIFVELHPQIRGQVSNLNPIFPNQAIFGPEGPRA